MATSGQALVARWALLASAAVGGWLPCAASSRPGGFLATGMRSAGRSLTESGGDDPRFVAAGVDGGEGRVCRGTSETDSSPSYYVEHSGIASLAACKALCVDTASCTGVEYWSAVGRCEVWTTAIGFTAESPGFSCWRFTNKVFETADAGVPDGLGLVCRGSNGPTDNSDSYFTLYSDVTSQADCRMRCASEPACTGIEYWGTGRRCEVWTVDIGFTAPSDSDFACLRYVSEQGSTPTVAMTTTTVVETTEQTDMSGGLMVVDQEDARISVGDEVRIYVVGSSNAPWQTWPDQLHLMLKTLGYRTPALDANHPDARMHPTSAPVCDDHLEYDILDTPRIGKVGWSSWGFAYDSRDDCSEDNFRNILGHEVSCTNAWACNPNWCCGVGGQPFIKPRDIAQDAGRSQITVLSNWINDSKQRYARNVCFNGEHIDPVGTANITVDSLRRIIQAIHAVNEDVVIVVLALYPEASGRFVVESTLDTQAAINRAVAEGLADEPNVVFANYTFPLGVNIFQEMHTGHANCRGDKVLATAVVEALFDARIIARQPALAPATECLGSEDCGQLAPACCQRSAMCKTNATTGSCEEYSPGVQ